MEFPLWKKIMVGLVCLLAVLSALPTFMPAMQENEESILPHKSVNLGLDLQGGSHLLLEVDRDVYLKEQLEGLVDELRVVLRKAGVGYRNLGVDGESAQFTLRDAADTEAASEAVRDLDRRFTLERDGDVFRFVLDGPAEAEMTRQLIEQSIEIVRRRVDETGTREPIIQRQGDNRIVLQVPGLQDPERLKALLGKTARLTFHLVDETIQPISLRDKAPAGTMIIPYEETEEGTIPGYIGVQRRIMLTGDLLVDANATFQEGQPVVSFRLNSQGARKFGDITRENVNRRFAVVLDNKAISAPVIREPIPGGSGVISGSFTVQTANDLAMLLRAGALPAPLKVLEERTVGPSLGQDSIEAGTKAAMLGVVLVILFMALAYGLFGVFSNLALIMNMVLIVAALSLLQATLTLPGIAGIVLTMGMAVDANVLIFERIKEELRLGKGVFAAVDNGFRCAFHTIIDSNLTTLIAAALLFYFGSGAIKGFAVTLSVGILTSMFSAILLTRMMVVTYVQKKRPKALTI